VVHPSAAKIARRARRATMVTLQFVKDIQLLMDLLFTLSRTTILERLSLLNNQFKQLVNVTVWEVEAAQHLAAAMHTYS
jgi:hypothetical protein